MTHRVTLARVGAVDGGPTRAARLERLATDSFDLLVVGGGVTGAGIARDAVQRGLSVALVERADFASGTSSKSSKLVHGGLRYLENFEFGLVFEGTRERAYQRRLNPHLVWPLAFVFPVYASDPNGLFKVNLGLWLYDLLSIFRGYRLHKRLSAAATRELVQGLRADELRGSVHYYDCRTDDARLALANALAAQRDGAVSVNYVEFVAPLCDDGRVEAATVRDVLTGREIEVRCRHVAYAAGPWTDQLPEAPGAGELLRPTKGVHIVVGRERLPVDHAVVMSAVADGRVVFAIPFATCTFIGTTDTDYQRELEAVRATAEDVAYLLDTTNRYFPEAGLVATDVRSTWAGLRPLIRSDAETAYKTSREHELFHDERGITTIAGGKLTTYRSMAAEVVDAAIQDLRPRGLGELARCRTHKVPLDPDLPPVEDPVRGPADPLDNALWRCHGSGAAWVRARMESHPAEAEALSPTLPHVLAQVSRAVLFEQAERLEDVLVRRLPLFYLAPDQGERAAEPVARHMAALLQRPAAWVESEIADYREVVEQSRVGWRALAAVDSAP